MTWRPPARWASSWLASSERIAGAIVGTGAAAVPLQLGEPLASWVLDPDVDKYRQMDPRATRFDAPAPVIHSSNNGAEIDYGPRGPQHRDNAQLQPAR
jgi:hypothetical protein